MDDQYLHHAVRYVERNPVSARLVGEAVHWPWSSARAHVLGEGDGVVSVKPMLDRVADWHGYLAESSDEGMKETIRGHGRTGRPAGSEAFLNHLEALSGRQLTPQKPGRKPVK